MIGCFGVHVTGHVAVCTSRRCRVVILTERLVLVWMGVPGVSSLLTTVRPATQSLLPSVSQACLLPVSWSAFSVNT